MPRKGVAPLIRENYRDLLGRNPSATTVSKIMRILLYTDKDPSPRQVREIVKDYLRGNLTTK